MFPPSTTKVATYPSPEITHCNSKTCKIFHHRVNKMFRITHFLSWFHTPTGTTYSRSQQSVSGKHMSWNSALVVVLNELYSLNSTLYSISKIYPIEANAMIFRGKIQHPSVTIYFLYVYWQGRNYSALIFFSISPVLKKFLSRRSLSLIQGISLLPRMV